MTKAEYQKAYYAANKERLRANSRAWWHANRDRLIQYDRDRYPNRREAMLKRLKASYPMVKDKKKLYNAEYNRTHKQEIKIKHKEWVARNRDHVRIHNSEYVKANPEKARIWANRWASKNPGRVKANETNRRARELGAVTDAESVKIFFQWIKNQDFVTCTYCGRYISGKSVHIDHIIPLSRRGHHTPDNFCVSCSSCNQSKSDLLLNEWPKCPEKFKDMALN